MARNKLCPICVEDVDQNFSCAQCDLYYCSRECQEADLIRHGDHSNIGNPPPSAVKIQAAKIIASNVRRTHPNKALVESIRIPLSHPIFKEGTKCEISEAVGVPLLVYKSTEQPPLFKRIDEWHLHYGSAEVSEMMRRINDSGGMDFGSSSRGFASGDSLYNVLVVRQDRQPLRHRDIDDFVTWCTYHLNPWFEWRDASVNSVKERDQIVLKRITPGTFGYWQQISRGQADEEWRQRLRDRLFVRGKGARDHPLEPVGMPEAMDIEILKVQPIWNV